MTLQMFFKDLSINQCLTLITIFVGLAHLCEFIEDCEHTSLAVRILHLLGKEGPCTRHPSR